MNGFDLILEKTPTTNELKKVLSETFEMKADFIYISEDIADFPTNKDNKLWCIIYGIGGQFSSLCKLFFNEDTETNTPIFIAKKICNQLNMHCLIDDNTIDPYSWIMLSPKETAKLVALDTNELEEDIYIIEE
jgi:hypothetical protein